MRTYAKIVSICIVLFLVYYLGLQKGTSKVPECPLEGGNKATAMVIHDKVKEGTRKIVCVYSRGYAMVPTVKVVRNSSR